MSREAAQFVGGIPENYDRGLAPHIFVDYGADLAARAADLAPRRVLEVAAGTGIVSRMLRDSLPSSSELVVTDLNPPMLDVARSKFREGENVRFEAADATDLSFGDGEFDLVVCQFGVMFFPDKDRGYRETWRVLAPGGRYLFNVWDSLPNNRFAQVAQETATRFFPDDPPRFYEVPFGYYEIEPIKASLAAAGFTDIDVDVRRVDKQIPKVEVFAKGLVYGNPLIAEIESRASAEPETILAAMTDALRSAFGEDPGQMSIQAITVCAAKP